jgi:hypothetical protein
MGYIDLGRAIAQAVFLFIISGLGLLVLQQPA